MKTSFIITVFLIFTILFIPQRLLAQTYLNNFKSVGGMAKLGEYVVFAADEGVHGAELWISDGTMAGTRLLKDIAEGPTGSNPSSLTIYKNEIYFAANNAVLGEELWKTDGTAAGTVLVKDIKSYELNYKSSSPKKLVVFENELYFLAQDNTYYTNIWKTNGTTAGTVQVYSAGFVGISDLTPVANSLYFLVNNSGQLWKIAGTTATISKVFQPSSEYHTIAEMTAAGSDLYFINHTTYRRKINLYKLPQGSNSPLLLKSFDSPSYGSNDIGNFTVVNSDVYFSVRTEAGSGYNDTDILWKTSGTPETTVPIKSIHWTWSLSGSYMQNFTAYKGKLFFSAISNRYEYHDLWTSDGSEAGTIKLGDVSVNNATRIKESNGSLYFNGNGELWTSDGTPKGTMLHTHLHAESPSNPNQLFDLNGVLFYTANDGSGLALWNNLPQPDINVSAGYRALPSSATLSFKSNVDSIVVKEVTIQNQGHKELTFSKIYVTGSDFFVNASLPRQLLPGAIDTIKVIYFPSKEGISHGTLSILNNDLNEGNYTIRLDGVTEASPHPPRNNVSIELNRIVAFDDNTGNITLDKNTVAENIPLGSQVGHLSVKDPAGDYTFTMVAGTGDQDNAAFALNSNMLTTASPIDYEKKNTYTIRVKATGQAQSLEQAILITVANTPEDIAYTSCTQEFSNIAPPLLDVAFIDNQKLFAIGAGGVILKSDDAGQNWVDMNSGVKATLRHIQFTDANTGYIIGDYSTLLKTENGGEDWFLLESPTTDYPYFSNLYFVDAKVGYVFGGEGNIFKTVDGGKSWSEHSYGFGEYNAAYFINKNKGFICGRSNVLLKTLNGGESWQTIKMDQFGWSLNFSDIRFVTDKVGFILGENGVVIKTEDGGDSWVKVGSASSGYGARLYFLSKSEGYIVGNGVISKTTDGGITWTFDSSAGGGNIGISFSKDNHYACVVGNSTSLGTLETSGRKIMLKEQGANWVTRTLFNPAGLRATHFVNSNTGYVFGSQNYKTTDGGITWSELNIGDRAEIRQCYFASVETAYALTNNEIFKTNNSGESWEKVLTELPPSFYFRGAYFSDAETGFAYGEGKDIYKTSNGGKSWTIVQTPATYNVNGLSFINASTGYALGDSENLLKTTDNGTHWSKVYSFAAPWLKNDIVYLTVLYFFNSSIGYAAGNDGLLFKTLDGGSTWSEIKTGFTTDIWDLKFIDEQTGYAVTGNSGILYKTTDGGLSWMRTYSSQSISRIAVNGSDLYLTGLNGVFTKLKDGRKATIPGYIKGETVVAEGTRIVYSVQPNTGTHYTWAVMPAAPIDYTDNAATVLWEKPGVYTLKVTPYKSCGWAEPREETVTVGLLPTPKIVGSETVPALKEGELYYTKYNEDSRYTWTVQGHKSYVTNNNEIVVTWGSKGKGKLEVIETLNGFASRKKATSLITITEVTGLPESVALKSLTLFPNPSEGIIHIELQNNKRQPLNIRIIDVSGKTYRTYYFDKWHNAFQGKIDITSLPQGLYIVEIKQGTEKVTKKMIKP